jgi:hypothetical protein
MKHAALFRIHIAACLIACYHSIFAALANQPAAPPTDWGYENYGSNPSASEPSNSDSSARAQPKPIKFGDQMPPLEPEPPKELSARALSGDWGDTKPSKQAAPAKGVNELTAFFELASQHKLNALQKSAVNALLLSGSAPQIKSNPAKGQPSSAAAANGKETNSLETTSLASNAPAKDTPASTKTAPNRWSRIALFMPAVEHHLKDHAQNAEDIGHLFCALLRLVCSSGKLPDEQVKTIESILGPPQILVAGNPALSDEALNAYNEMACFMFEQKNPGKTVEAEDNRAVFRHVIKDKFQEAPTLKDKQAMANFAVTWGKFKVAWDLASAPEKALLLANFNQGKTPSSEAEPELARRILGNGPWHD